MYLNFFLKVTSLLASFFVITFSVIGFAQESQINFLQYEKGIPVGDGVIESKALTSSEYLISYSYDRTTLEDPIEVSYNYSSYRDASGDMSYDMFAILNDYDSRLDPNVKIDYKGDRVTFPSKIKTGTSLTDVGGEFLFTKPGTPLETAYVINILNRKLIDKKEVLIHDRRFMAYKHSYLLYIKVKSSGELIENKKEERYEWFVPEYGVIQREMIVYPDPSSTRLRASDAKISNFSTKSIDISNL